MKSLVHENEERLHALITNVSDVVMTVDREGIITYSNTAMEKLFGYLKGELIGKHPSILNAGSKTKERTTSIIDILKKENYLEGEIANKKKDCKEFISYARICALKARMAEYILSTQHDISNHKRIEDALLQSQRNYHTLFDSNKDGVIYTDLNGKILDANKAYLDLFGYTLEEIKEFTYQQLTPKKWHKLEEDIVKNQIKARGYSDEYEKEYIKKRRRGCIISSEIRLESC